MTQEPEEGREAVPRQHGEAPAEGDESADPSGPRVHGQDPAEGADDEDGASG